MTMHTTPSTPSLHGSPDLMPVLSRGKHRNPKKGACFMELASFLAGEAWSDHPACTHPLLASLARDVNDHVGDDARSQLATQIPEVIGLRSTDPRADVWIAREAALAALPVTAAERQGVAAVGLLRCERMLNHLEDRPRGHLSTEATLALDGAPHARDWARGFTSIGWGNPGSFGKRSAPAIVHSAVSGIAVASVPDSDQILVGLLRRVIYLCQARFAHESRPVDPGTWQELGALTQPRRV